MEATVDTGVRLAPHETAEGRGFTDPARTADDLAAVRVMLLTVRHLTDGPAGARPFVLEAREADGREHRTIICNGPRLRDGRDVAWVGFFAVKRRDVDPAPLHVRDDESSGVSRPSGHPRYAARGRRRRLGKPDPRRRGRRPRALADQRAARPRGARARAPPLHRRATPCGCPRGGRAGPRGADPPADEVLRLPGRHHLAGGAGVARVSGRADRTETG